MAGGAPPSRTSRAKCELPLTNRACTAALFVPFHLLCICPCISEQKIIEVSPLCSDLTAIDPLKYVVDLPENLQEREKFDLYNEMILQLQMARANLLRQQKKPVSCEDLIAFDVGGGGKGLEGDF